MNKFSSDILEKLKECRSPMQTDQEGIKDISQSANIILKNSLGLMFSFAFADKNDADLLNELGECLNKLGSSLPSAFIANLPGLKQQLILDAEAILAGDPAAKSFEEVIICYPGFYAIASHRIASFLLKAGQGLLARAVSELAHSSTGVDIHPGATIGTSFCIDHGTGIVIGETTEIGNNVKLYHGVTLGGLSVKKEFASTKRHPTIEDDVTIYSNAIILGGQTVIGKGTIIGGNVWLTHSVEENSIVEIEEQQLNIRKRTIS